MKLSWTRHHTYFFWGSVAFLTVLSLSFFSIFTLLMNELNTQTAALAQNKSIELGTGKSFAEDIPSESKASISIQAGNPFLQTGSAIGLYDGVSGVISIVINGDETQLKDCDSASDGAVIINSSETGKEISAITISRCNLRNGDLFIPGVNLNAGEYLLRVNRDDVVSNTVEFYVSPAIRPQNLQVSLASDAPPQSIPVAGQDLKLIARWDDNRELREVQGYLSMVSVPDCEGIVLNGPRQINRNEVNIFQTQKNKERYHFCLRVKGDAPYGQVENTFVTTIQATSFGLTITIPTTVPGNRIVRANIATTGTPQAPPIQFVDSPNLTWLGPLTSQQCASTNIEGVTRTPILYQITSSDLLNGFIDLQVPTGFVPGNYALEFNGNFNGVQATTRSPCTRLERAGFGVAITSVGRAMASRPFPVGIDIGPEISGGFSASITWTDQGMSRSKSISNADVQAGFVTIVAPQQPGVYKLTLSAIRLVDGAQAVTSTGMPNSPPDVEVLPVSARSEKVLIPTIYVLAVNNEASPASRIVFEKLVSTMSFFTNIPDISPESIASLQRDYNRLLDMRGMVNALDNYRGREGQYPTVSSGSFVPNFTISRWKSWQEVLGKAIGFAPLDPENEFGNQDNFSLIPNVLTILNPQPSQTTLLPDGLSSGMGVVYQSREPVNRTSVSKVLSVNAEGNAASWELKIGNGVVTRLFDSPVPEDVLARQNWYRDICLKTGLKCETRSSPTILRVASRGHSGGNVVFAQSFYQFPNPQRVGVNQYFEYEGRCVNGPCTAYLHLLTPNSSLSTISTYPFSPRPILDTTWRTVRIRLEPNLVFDRILIREESDVSTEVRSEFRNIRIVEENQQDGTFIPVRTLWNGEQINSPNYTCRMQGGAVFRSREEGSVIVHFDPTQPSRSTNPPLRGANDVACRFNDFNQSNSFAAGLNDYLVERGARNMSATEIAQAIIQNKLDNGTTLVFAQDMIPQELADPNFPLTDSLLRRFIDQGGKVIVLGQQPLSTISTGTSLLSVRKENFGDYEMLANVAPDPCPGHDPQTCWSQSQKTFACPFNSRIYVYRALSPQRFQLAANLENPNMRWGIDVFDQKWPGTNISRVEFFITECSDPASIAAARSGIYGNGLTFCGDGLVQAPQEQCEIGDTRNMCSARRYYLDGDGTYRRIPARFRNSTQWRGAKIQSCSSNCTFEAIEDGNGTPLISTLDAQCGGFCGDGITQYPLEECDRSFDPALSGNRCSNGTLPSCGSTCRSSCSSGQIISCAIPGEFRNLQIIGLIPRTGVNLSVAMPRLPNINTPPQIKNYVNMQVPDSGIISIGPLPVIGTRAIDDNVVCGYSLKIGNNYYTIPPTPASPSEPWVVNINLGSAVSTQ